MGKNFQVTNFRTARAVRKYFHDENKANYRTACTYVCMYQNMPFVLSVSNGCPKCYKPNSGYIMYTLLVLEVCMHVYMYVCIYVCMYICMYVCVCMYGMHVGIPSMVVATHTGCRPINIST